MTRTVITVEYEIPGFSQQERQYYSDQSILDADIVVFKPQTFWDGGGKAEFDERESEKVKKSTRHWRQEISTALEYGKTIFLILGKYQVGEVRTGQKEFKGNRTINYVTDCNNYEFLPVKIPPINSKGGTEIVFAGHPVFAKFWKEFKPYLKYDAYLTENVTTPIFLTKTGERPLGAVFKVGKGHLVVLPAMPYDRQKFIKYDKNDKGTWTKEALKFGTQLVDALFEIDAALKADTKRTPPPSWISEKEFASEKERKLLQKIEDLDEKAVSLQKEKDETLSTLEEEKKLKDLLFETGKPLENAVIQALKLMGYSAENFSDGELEFDQVILSPEGERFIGESEGKDNNAINIDKFRQLEENIQSDLQREEVEEPAIGVLFGNGFRLTHPNDRDEQFTTKCLASAKRGTALVRTMDLYPIARYLQKTNDETYAKECREAILAGRGKVVEFPAIPPKK